MLLHACSLLLFRLQLIFLSGHRVGASSAQVLPLKRAPSLHTQKGYWYDELLSVH